jgi:malonyl-CoA O-methyltransferase
MFSTLGPDTLKELRSSFVDGYAHTQRFADMHDLGDMVVGCGFADPVMDMEVVTLTYDDLDALCRTTRSGLYVCHEGQAALPDGPTDVGSRAGCL